MQRLGSHRVQENHVERNKYDLICVKKSGNFAIRSRNLLNSFMLITRERERCFMKFDSRNIGTS